MGDCSDDEKTTKMSNETTLIETPKANTTSNSNNADNNNHNLEAFNLSNGSLHIPDLNSNHKRVTSDPTLQQRHSFPLESLEECANGDEDVITEVHHHHHPHNNNATASRRGVKSAGKKVLQVAAYPVTRPWKSVKRRFTGVAQHRSDSGGGDHSSSYGSTDPVALGAAAGTVEHSEISAATHRSGAGGIMGSSPLPSSVREFLASPAASMRGSGGDPHPITQGAAAAAGISSSTDSVVATTEWVLRHVVLLSAAFWAGAKFPQHVSVVQKIAEYTTVAWLTCAVIKGTAAWQEFRQLQRIRQYMVPVDVATAAEQVPLLSEREEEEEEDVAKVKHKKSSSHQHEDRSLREACEDVQHAQSFESTDTEKESQNSASSGPDELVEKLLAGAAAPEQSLVHPALNPFYVITTDDCRRVFPNSYDKVFPLDTDYFSGKMLTLIRTPDVDDEQATRGTSENEKASSYFRGKQRRFDYQFELRLKRVPKGRVYFVVELEEPVKMGMIQRAFASAALVRKADLTERKCVRDFLLRFFFNLI